MIEEAFIEKLRRLMEAREERDTDKKRAEASEKAYRELEAEVHLELAEGPLDRLNNIDLGPPWNKVSFHAKETIYARVIDTDKALEGFEQRAIIDEVTEPKIVMQRANELVRAAKDAGDPMPPGLDYVPRRYIQITKQKGTS